MKFYVHGISEKIWLCVYLRKTKHFELSMRKTKHLKTTWTGYKSWKPKKLKMFLQSWFYRNQHTLIPGSMHGTCMHCSSQAPLSYSSATWWDNSKTQIIFKGKLFWLPPVHTVLITWPYTMNWKSPFIFL